MADNKDIMVTNAIQSERISVLTERVNRLENTMGRLFYLLLGNLFALIILLLKELL